MFEPLGIDIVGAGERVHLINRSIRAILRVQTLANRLGIQDSSDLKSTEPKTIDRRL
jgi:hypothetical protein